MATWQNWAGLWTSLCGMLATVALTVRWLHKWFNRLENVVKTVEAQTSELTPSAPAETPSLRDDVSEILSCLGQHLSDMAVMKQQLAKLSEELGAHLRSTDAHPAPPAGPYPVMDATPRRSSLRFGNRNEST